MVFALLGLSSCENDDEATAGNSIIGSGTVNDIVNANGSLTSLRSALKTASGDLSETLKDSGPFTLFAPNNSAFDALAAQARFENSADLLANIDPALLSKILTYHVVAGKSSAGDLSEGTTLATVQGDELTITVSEDGTIQLLDASKLPQTNPVSNVTNSNPDAANGIVHFIDKVLLPQEAIEALGIEIRPSILDWGKATEDLSLLIKALDKVGLEDAVKELDSATVLAPTDQAIEGLFEELGDDYNSLEDFDNEAEIALLRDIMSYHILPASADLTAGQAETALDESSVGVISVSGGFEFGDATSTKAGIVTADIDAKNGSVQIIDKVLLPQAVLDFKATLESDDLTTVVVNETQLSKLEEALIATELVDAFADATNESFVQGEDEKDEDFQKRSTPSNYTYFKPATVFAPTDAAFDDLFSALGGDYTGIDSFDTEDELALLKEILLYHVVPGKVISADLTAGKVTTAAKSDIEVIAAVGTDDFVIGDATNNVNANIVTPDVTARNGVAHIVDKVLLPQRAIAFIKSLNEVDGDM